MNKKESAKKKEMFHTTNANNTEKEEGHAKNTAKCAHPKTTRKNSKNMRKCGNNNTDETEQENKCDGTTEANSEKEESSDRTNTTDAEKGMISTKTRKMSKKKNRVQQLLMWNVKTNNLTSLSRHSTMKNGT